MIRHGGDGSVLQNGAIVPETSELGMHLLHGASHQDFLSLGFRGLEREGLVLPKVGGYFVLALLFLS